MAARRWLVQAALVLLVWQGGDVVDADAYASPWMQVIMDGMPKNLMLSTMTQGIVLYQDDLGAADEVHRSAQVNMGSNLLAVATRIKILKRPHHAFPWPVDGIIGVGIKSTRTEILWPYVNASLIDSIHPPQALPTLGIYLSHARVESIAWAEAMNVIEDPFYTRYTSFPMFELSMCGHALLDATSSYWNTVVDFQSPCLTLPKEFYVALVAWAPLEFNATANLTTVAAGVASSDLPTLHFRLSPFSPWLALPLQALAMPANASQLCIQQGESVRRLVVENEGLVEDEDLFVRDAILASDQAQAGLPDGPDLSDQKNSLTDGETRVPHMYKSPIVLGTLALQSLGLIVHVNRTQIGFPVNQSASAWPLAHPEATCKPAIQCEGHQIYHHDTNTCTNPNCELRIFHRFDPATKTCVVNPAWQLLALAVVGVCTFYELYFDFVRTRLGRQVMDEQ
ncbi:Aste57867_20390 [Aphanomyces stellatus]|uniref:Aste57867_20390 protein n=1 Tax=Aphanomyces stellatus TaxID=120398 RepID=A0A485LF05_9STRA|nr:hypothetical protein As57867_020324 [Aphanomyces stellatus]VFT97076.1 Aste57867_20390 [Aphanomyces stellatus]